MKGTAEEKKKVGAARENEEENSGPLFSLSLLLRPPTPILRSSTFSHSLSPYIIASVEASGPLVL